MGLDQYAGKQNHTYEYEYDGKKHFVTGVVPFECRKHSRLQEFMTRLAMKKKGKEPTDINKLPDDIKETKKNGSLLMGIGILGIVEKLS